MLVLTRKLMQRLYIGDNICITVVRLEGGQVRLGIEAPKEVAVVRGELTDRPRAGVMGAERPVELDRSVRLSVNSLRGSDRRDPPTPR